MSNLSERSAKKLVSIHGAEEPSLEDEVNLDQSQEHYGTDQDNPDPEPTVEEYFAGHIDILPLTKRTCRNCSTATCSISISEERIVRKSTPSRLTSLTRHVSLARLQY
jgi:hypothetical protein